MRIVVLSVIAGILAVSPAMPAQGMGACCGKSPGPLAATALVELKGKVTAVQITPGGGMPFVTVKSGDQVMKVQLGSMRYLMAQGFNPKVDEDIAVKAYKVGDDYVAALVTLPSQKKSVRLRDESGRPVWRGGPWRQ